MKKLSFIFILFLLTFSIYSQNTLLTYNGSGNYELIERTDLRRYDNGKYIGLMSREVSSFIIPRSDKDGYLYDGTFYIDEKTRRNMRKAGISVNDAIPSIFKIDDKGKLTMLLDNGFPSFRSFPSFPDTMITLGSSWEAKAERAVDPLNKGIITKMPIYVRYTYIGDTIFNDEEVYLISAQWATRYGMGVGNYYIDWSGDETLEKATGSHKATIYVSKNTGNAVLIKDIVDETFFYNDGNQITFKGTISLFTKYPPAIDRTKIIPALKRIANLTDEEVEQLSNPENSIEELVVNPNLITKIDENNSYDEDAIFEYIDNSNSIEDTTNLKDESKLINETNRNNDIENNFNNAISSINNNSTNKEINIKIDNTKAGIRLTIHNLQFLPDSSELIPGQTQKLEEIAQVLKELPNGRFLIEGHTAMTGNERGELKLSLERAEAIANEFVKRGLNQNQFICRGSGGKKPIADNSTKEGKALNRRVEITILE